MKTTVICLAVLLLAGLAQADIPATMSYQGVLKDALGDPVPDGVYSVTFRIYSVSSGGSALWTETQSLASQDGVIEAILGSNVPLSSLAFDVPYWLGVAVSGEPELTPRTALTSVPYAAHAGYADTCLEGDDDWQTSGSNIYRNTGNVGVGTATPAVKLDVLEGAAAAARFENNAATSGFTVRAVNNGGTAGAFFSKVSSNSYPYVDAAVYGAGGATSRGAHFSSDGHDAIFAASPSGKAIWGYSTGNYSGYFSGGGLGVYVDDLIHTRGFRLSTGPAAGYVLTSDVNGYGTWQPAGGSDGDWTISGNNMYSTVIGNVGVGLTLPTAKLEVNHDSGSEALEVKHSNWPAGRVANIEWTSNPGSLSDVLQLKTVVGAPDDCQFIECERGSIIEFAVDGDGSITTNGTLDVNGTDEVQASFVSNFASTTAKVVSAVSTSTAMYDGVGVYGESVPADYYGIGGKFIGGYRGVMGQINPSGVGSYSAVYGYVDGGSGTNVGVQGSAYGGNVAYGVYGYASAGAGSNYAGYFNGDVNITGTLYGGVPAMRIDHPLDPEGMYLAHSAVESDEMMNIYNGNVTLDGRGEAWVEMPGWFEALNRDFRYQLTCIGAYAPVFVAQTMTGGRFMIAGGEPGMVVSWQVTGVRHDPAAVAHRVAVEQAKPADEVGRYVHPEAYGRPETESVGHIDQRPVPDGSADQGRSANRARERYEG